MTHEDLMNLTVDLHVAEEKIRNTKGHDYGGNVDALDFFKRIEHVIGTDRLLVCWILLQKHLASVQKVVEGGAIRSESLFDHILDARGYLTLLYALRKEHDLPCS